MSFTSSTSSVALYPFISCHGRSERHPAAGTTSHETFAHDPLCLDLATVPSRRERGITPLDTIAMLQELDAVLIGAHPHRCRCRHCLPLILPVNSINDERPRIPAAHSHAQDQRIEDHENWNKAEDSAGNTSCVPEHLIHIKLQSLANRFIEQEPKLFVPSGVPGAILVHELEV